MERKKWDGRFSLRGETIGQAGEVMAELPAFSAETSWSVKEGKSSARLREALEYSGCGDSRTVMNDYHLDRRVVG